VGSAGWACPACRLDGRPSIASARGPTDPGDTLDGLFAAPVNRLITELARLPGIGQRTAQRLAFHLLSASGEEALALADAIREVKETVGHCEVCFNLATEATCRICQDERRETATICVVEQPSDVIPIERSGEFHGRYHVLGGALSPIDGVDPEDLHIAELLARVGANGAGAGVREVVIATNATTTGEATALYLADALRERAPDVAVTRLASGLPVGSDLEYADEITLGRALRGRQAL
jgi:recombination protein RecR